MKIIREKPTKFLLQTKENRASTVILTFRKSISMMFPIFKFTQASDAGDLDFFCIFFVRVFLKSRETFIDPRSIIVNR